MYKGPNRDLHPNILKKLRHRLDNLILYVPYARVERLIFGVSPVLIPSAISLVTHVTVVHPHPSKMCRLLDTTCHEGDSVTTSSYMSYSARFLEEGSDNTYHYDNVGSLQIRIVGPRLTIQTLCARLTRDARSHVKYVQDICDILEH